MSGLDEFKHLSDREVLLLTVERIDGVLEKVKEHDDNIASLMATRSENSGFFRGVNWLIGLPGVIALILGGKQHL